MGLKRPTVPFGRSTVRTQGDSNLDYEGLISKKKTEHVHFFRRSFFTSSFSSRLLTKLISDELVEVFVVEMNRLTFLVFALKCPSNPSRNYVRLPDVVSGPRSCSDHKDLGTCKAFLIRLTRCDHDRQYDEIGSSYGKPGVIVLRYTITESCSFRLAENPSKAMRRISKPN